ncbi:rhomboid family intramembrane serine protease, partial [Xanthomonas citri pv. citri]|nr:rhomboid family intramembrane serine protease [Xanthomonas citri pv. citri]
MSMHRPSPGLPDRPGGPAPAPTLAERAGGRLLGAVAPTAVLITAMWVAQVVLIFLGRVIIPGVGLIPRRLDGLDGVLFSPVLHAGWAHLIGNTTALLVLGPLAALVS